jgi:predicted peroxiredoxin
MSHYLFIDSRDAFESRDTEFVVATAGALRQSGNEVTLFLISNGVMAARRHAPERYLSAAAAAGVSILADGFSLLERGITPGELHPAIRTSDIDAVVDMLAAGAKALWH